MSKCIVMRVLNSNTCTRAEPRHGDRNFRPLHNTKKIICGTSKVVVPRKMTIVANSHRNCAATVSAFDPENFTWKGGGDGLGERWEEPGMYIEAPEGSGVEWFFLDVGSKQSTQPPMLLLHGIPAFSYMWRNVLPDLVGAGRRAIVVDFPGFGNSSMIQVGVGFNYTIEEYVAALDSLVERMGLDSTPIDVVAPGLLGGTVGALWAARNPEKVAKLTLMNTPLDAQSAGELPKALKPLTNPFTSAIFCQNPLNVVGKPIEGSGPYALDVNDQAVYLAPTLADGNAGFIAIAVAKELQKNAPKAVKEALAQLAANGSPAVEIVWGNSDDWLGEDPPSSVKSVATSIKKLPGAGHFAPEDWPEKVAAALLDRPISS